MSPKDRESKTPKQKRRLKNSSNKYLKPGALAQFRYNKATAVKSYADLGKKSVALMAAKNAEHNDHAVQSKVMDKSPLMLSPVDVLKQNALVRTPKTPRMEEYDSESRLESLPMDLLVLLTLLHFASLSFIHIYLGILRFTVFCSHVRMNMKCSLFYVGMNMKCSLHYTVGCFHVFLTL